LAISRTLDDESFECELSPSGEDDPFSSPAVVVASESSVDCADWAIASSPAWPEPAE
jgi:hypothetical protein